MSLTINQRIEYIEALHHSPTQVVAALSGGGTLILSDLLTVPGGSHTLIEAAVPYSCESISNYIGRVPEQFCCSRTARSLAMTAFYHARKILRSEALRKHGYVNPEQVSPKTVDVSHDISGVSESAIIRSFEFVEPEDLDESDAYQHVIGIGCTASLATDRQKRGEHRVHIAIQTLQQTLQFSLQLQKDARTRLEEERLVADLILNAIETARREAEHHSHAMPPNFSGTGEILCPAFIESISENYPLYEQIPLNLKPEEVVRGELAVGSPLLVNLFFGKLGAVLWADDEIRHSVTHKDIITPESPFNERAEFTQAIFPGSFSPIHKGHLEMLNVAEQRLQSKIVLEMSIHNVNKPPFDYIDLKHRLAYIHATNPKQTVWLTQTPLFVHKAGLFRGTSFVVGADTIKRFADLRFYHENVHKLHEILRTVAFHNCRFLVFARQSKSGLESLDTLEIPDMLRSLCDEVPPSVFTMDISSSDLRREEKP